MMSRGDGVPPLSAIYEVTTPDVRQTSPTLSTITTTDMSTALTPTLTCERRSTVRAPTLRGQAAIARKKIAAMQIRDKDDDDPDDNDHDDDDDDDDEQFQKLFSQRKSKKPKKTNDCPKKTIVGHFSDVSVSLHSLHICTRYFRELKVNFIGQF
jgi:hypothetical protein